MPTIEVAASRQEERGANGRMEMRNRITVLMAVYNGERWLAEQLHSIFVQQEVLTRVLACDDGSSDNSVKVIDHFVRSKFPIQLISSDLPGGSAGQNFFRLIIEADLLDAEFVAFCDQDDVWRPDHLARAIKMLQQASADAFSGAAEAFWPDGRRRLLSQSAIVRRADYLFEGAGQGCTFVIRRKMFEQIRKVLHEHASRLQLIHYHDWTVYAVARRLGCHWVFDPEVAISYRQHGENDTGARWSTAGVQKRLNLIWSGWYGNQIATISALAAMISPPSNYDGSPLGSKDPDLYLALRDSAKSNLIARFKLAYWIFRYGRRKRSDRAVLSIAALLGKL